MTDRRSLPAVAWNERHFLWRRPFDFYRLSRAAAGTHVAELPNRRNQIPNGEGAVKYFRTVNEQSYYPGGRLGTSRAEPRAMATGLGQCRLPIGDCQSACRQKNGQLAMFVNRRYPAGADFTSKHPSPESPSGGDRRLEYLLTRLCRPPI